MPHRELTHFSLFSGIGGIDLAAEWAGFETVGQCEWADYPTKVLEKHWPNVLRWRDVRDVTVESIRERGINEITLLSGGFPCQPHSVAGKRKASADDRDLWGEFARIICEVRPRWVLAENVPGLLSSEDGRFFGRILNDLAKMGYAVGWCCYGAADVGARHKRDRVFIIANSNSNGCNIVNQRENWSKGAALSTVITPGGIRSTYDGKSICSAGQIKGNGNAEQSGETNVADTNGERELQSQGHEQKLRGWTSDSGETMADAKSGESRKNMQRIQQRPRSGLRSYNGQDGSFNNWWETEPELGRSPYGLSGILDGIGGLSGEAKIRGNEILRNLRTGFTKEKIQWAPGGFDGISKEEILLAFLCEYEEICFRSGIALEGRTTAERLLRDLWRTIESARASYRRGYNSQLAQEYSDALLRLSHGAPSLMPQAWANGSWEDGIERVSSGIKNRVDRLKCLGNAVVPQQVYPIFQAIADIKARCT